MLCSDSDVSKTQVVLFYVTGYHLPLFRTLIKDIADAITILNRYIFSDSENEDCMNFKNLMSRRIGISKNKTH